VEDDFHGYPAAAWQDDEPAAEIAFHHRWHAWVGGPWMVTVHSFDDTDYLLAYDPRSVSEAIYRRLVAHGVLAAGWGCRTAGACVPGLERCVEPGGTLGCGFCQLEAADECATDRDCVSQGTASICRRTTALDCGTPCFGSVRRCFPGCVGDEACDGGRCGSHHRCVSRPCAGDDDCAVDFICAGDQCARRPCASDADCGGAFCVDSQCYEQLGTCQVLPA
jgi:hypothetical protein